MCSYTKLGTTKSDDLKDSIKKLLAQDQDRKELLSKSGVFVVLRVLGLLLGYLFTILITRNFGGEIYGYIALSLSFFMIFSVIGKLGWDVTFTRYVSSGQHSKEDLQGHLYRMLLLGGGFTLLLSLLVVYLRDPIAIHVFKEPELADYLFWSGITFPFWSLMLIISGFFRGLRRNTLFAFFNAFGRFLLSFLVLGALLLLGAEHGIDAMKAHFIAITVLFLAALALLPKLGYKPSLRKPRIVFRRFQRQSQPILFSSVVFILLTWSDRLVLGAYRPAAEVGTYDVVAKLGLLIGFNLEAINSILAPKISQFFYGSRKAELQKLIAFSTRISSVIAVFSYVFLMLLGNFFLGIFGEEYVGSTSLLALIGAGQLFNCLFGSVGTILQMTGHQRDYLGILLLGLIFNLGLSFLMVGKYGALGVAFATSVSLVIWNLAGSVLVYRRLGLHSYLRFSRSYNSL